MVCVDALKQHAVLPCLHNCLCEACAQRLLDERTPCCPVCRGPIERILRVFPSVSGQCASPRQWQ